MKKLLLVLVVFLPAMRLHAQFATLAIQDFDTVQTPAWPYVHSSGTLTFNTGNSPATGATPTNSPFGVGGTWAWTQQGQSGGVMLTFNNVNITGYDTAYVSFHLAAFALSDGVDASDYVRVGVSVNNGTNWYDQIDITGASGGNSSWPYTATGEAVRVFSTATKTVFPAPLSGLNPAGYSTVTIKVPNTTNQVRLRITLRSSTSSERWCADNVSVKVRASVSDNASASAITSPVNQCPGTQDIKARISNRGSTIINNVTVNWMMNSVTQTPLYWSAPIDTLGGTGRPDTVLTLGTVTTTPTSSDTIVVWTSMPNGVPDLFTADDTVSTIVRASLNGTYTIGGTSPDFATVAAAATRLSLVGVCGPVEFVVAPGTYTGQVLVSNVQGASAINTVTFRGANAATCIITSSTSSGATVLINSSNYIHFRNLTITNTVSGNGTAVAITGNVASNAGTGCSVKNCIINLPNVSASTSYGVLVTGTVSGYGTSNNYIDSVQIDSNVITGGYYGIVVYGNTTSPSNLRNRAHKIRNNTLNNQYSTGVFCYYIYNGIEVIKNEITLNTSLGNTSGIGIDIENCLNTSGTVSHQFIGNKVLNAGYLGLYLVSADGGAANPTKIYNNMIGGGFAIDQAYGLYLQMNSGTYAEVYHNSVNLDFATSLAENSAFYCSGSVNVKVKNNIFVYSAELGMGMPAYMPTSPAAGNVNSNIYTNVATAGLVYRGTSFYTRSNFKTIAAGGDSSLTIANPFASASNLHILNGCLSGSNLTAFVSTDIDGDTRSATPNIGADEVIRLADNIAIDSVLAPLTQFIVGAQDLVVRVRNTGNNIVSGFNISYQLGSASPVSLPWSGSLNPCDTVSVVFSGSNQIVLGSVNSFMVYTASPNSTADANPLDDTLRLNYILPLSGTYTIGATASDFTTFNQAVFALKTGGVAGPVTFQVRTGTYNERVALTSISGLSATNRVTFISMANHPDSVMLSFNTTPTISSIITLVNINYINFKSISISGLSTSYGRGVELMGSSSFDTIENCKMICGEAGIFAMDITGVGNVIRNNTMTVNGYAVYIDNSNIGTTTDNHIIENNTFNMVNASYGAYLYYTRNLKFRKNTITGTTSYGMYTRYMYDAFECTGNIINISSTSYGLYMYYNVGSAFARVLIANNSIAVNGSYGIRNQVSSYQSFYNNTFNVTGTYGVYINYASSYSNNEWKNNVIANTTTGVAAFITNSGTNNVWDYNLYYTPGTSLFSANATLPLWRAASGQDMNSITARPAFISNTNLTPLVTDTMVWLMNGRGVQLPAITTDLNNNPRSVTVAGGAPDLGAFEFTPTALPPTATAIPASPVAGATQYFTLAGDTIARINWANGFSVPSVVDLKLYTGTIPPAVDSVTDKYMRTYWDFNIAPGTYMCNTILNYKDPWLGTNPVESNIIGTYKNPFGAWTAFLSPASTVDSINNAVTIQNVADFGYFTITDNTNPLPVELMYFGAQAQQNDVRLDWMTATEVNANRFEIERSTGTEPFKQIGFVAAKGNSSEQNSYQYMDKGILSNPNHEVIYYRLKMTDHDGSFRYSNMVSINSKPKLAVPSQLVVSPNPFNNTIFISAREAIQSGATATVYDLSGKQVMRVVCQNNAAHSGVVSAELNGLRAGVYILAIENGSNIWRTRIVKIQ